MKGRAFPEFLHSFNRSAEIFLSHTVDSCLAIMAAAAFSFLALSRHDQCRNSTGRVSLLPIINISESPIGSQSSHRCHYPFILLCMLRGVSSLRGVLHLHLSLMMKKVFRCQINLVTVANYSEQVRARTHRDRDERRGASCLAHDGHALLSCDLTSSH